MNIVLDFRSLLSGRISGVENYTRELCFELIKQNPHHHFIIWVNNFKKSKIDFSHFQSKNSDIIQTRIPNKFINISLSLFNFPKIDKLLKQPIDLILMPDLRPISSSKRYRIFCTIHDLSFHHFPKYFSLKSRLWYKLLNLKKLIKKFNHIFTVSEFTKSEILKYFHPGKDKITVAYPGVPLHFIKQSFAHIQAKYHLPEKYFLSLSTIEPRKNIKNTLLGFQTFNQSNPSYHLVIAGKQNPNLFAKQNLPLNPHVHFTGFIDEEDKYAVYQHSQGLIYLSLYEGFGLPIIEAAHAQIPILTSNSTSTAEIAPLKALLADPKSRPDISLKIKKLSEIQKPVIYPQPYLDKFQWQKTAALISKYF